MMEHEEAMGSELPSGRRLAIGFRADLYRALAAAFVAPPTNETVSALSGDDMADLLAGFIGEEAARPVRAGGRVEDEVIRQEYFDLLAVPTDRYLTPFEAVYCDQREVQGEQVRGLLNGCSTRRVENAYAASGLAVGLKELPDHVGCELGFMAEMCAREAAALDAGDLAAANATAEKRREFARNHPARWVPRLCDRMESVAHTAFYKTVARITSALVADEAHGPGAEV